jgi:hypothetical protein
MVSALLRMLGFALFARSRPLALPAPQVPES